MKHGVQGRQLAGRSTQWSAAAAAAVQLHTSTVNWNLTSDAPLHAHSLFLLCYTHWP